MLWKSNGEHKVVGHRLTWWSTEDSTHMFSSYPYSAVTIYRGHRHRSVVPVHFFNSKFLQKDYI